MDATKEPGIRITGIVVEHLRFDDITIGQLPTTDHVFQIKIERRQIEGATVGEAVLHFFMKPKEGVESSFYFEADVAGRFETSGDDANMQLETFLKINGPAQLVPFLREIVANITFRSRHGVVLLPAINVIALVQREETAPQA